MKFIRVKMEVFVPMKKTVASNVLAEMDMVDNCATKKVYHSPPRMYTHGNVFLRVFVLFRVISWLFSIPLGAANSAKRGKTFPCGRFSFIDL